MAEVAPVGLILDRSERAFLRGIHRGIASSDVRLVPAFSVSYSDSRVHSRCSTLAGRTRPDRRGLSDAWRRPRALHPRRHRGATRARTRRAAGVRPTLMADAAPLQPDHASASTPMVSRVRSTAGSRAPSGRDRCLPPVPRLRAHDWWIWPARGRIRPVTAPVLPRPKCGDCYDGEP